MSNPGNEVFLFQAIDEMRSLLREIAENTKPTELTPLISSVPVATEREMSAEVEDALEWVRVAAGCLRDKGMRRVAESADNSLAILRRALSAAPPPETSKVPRASIVEVCNAADAHADHLRRSAASVPLNDAQDNHRKNAFTLAKKYNDCAAEARSWLAAQKPSAEVKE